jgi:lysophospholipase L1-like esterase
MKGLPMKSRKSATLVAVSVFAVLLSLPSTAQEKLNVIAVYGESFDKPESVQKFRYMWNARGAVGKAGNYESLTFVEKDKAYMKVDENGKQIPGTPKAGNWMCYPGNDSEEDKDKIARYLIGACKMENDSAGNVWLVNGNLQHPYGRTEKDTVDLKVFVNDNPKQDITVKFSRIPTLFNANLGKLKKGDTIYLAVGPGEVCEADYFKLFCTIADIPEGTEPPPPKNIIFPPADTPHPKMSADGNPQPGYPNALKGHNSSLLKNMPEILFIGDSITAGWNKDVMKEKFAKYKTMQIGIGGDWTQNVLWRVENSTLDQVKPKLIILMIGTNNFGHGYSVDDIVAGNAAILKAIKKKTPDTKVLLLGIFPRGKKMSDAGNTTIKEINEKLQALADGKKIFFLDIGGKLVEPDGTLNRNVFYDGLHLTKEGYIRWSDAILPTVDKLMAPAGK